MENLIVGDEIVFNMDEHCSFTNERRKRFPMRLGVSLSSVLRNLRKGQSSNLRATPEDKQWDSHNINFWKAVAAATGTTVKAVDVEVVALYHKAQSVAFFRGGDEYRVEFTLICMACSCCDRFRFFMIFFLVLV